MNEQELLQPQTDQFRVFISSRMSTAKLRSGKFWREGRLDSWSSRWTSL